MKIRLSILVFFAIVVVLIALLLWHKKKNPAEVSLVTSVKTNVAPTTMSISSQPVNMPVQTNASVPILVTNVITSSFQNHKWEQMQPGLELNDQPIVFYGKVEDQFNNVIAGAIVNFGVRIHNSYESTVKSGEVISDTDGLFTISGYKGQELGIGVQKTGYVFVSMSGSGIYSKLWPENQRAHPDPNNPTVIKMYKLQGAQQLVNFSIKTHIPIDGTPIRFDLKNSQQVQTGGDLIVSIKSSPEPNFQTGYDWQASIQVVNGGIIQDSDSLGFEKMFQAPDSGYLSEFDLSFQKGTQQWTSRFIGEFYFTTQNNQNYGKISISVITDRVKDGAIPFALNGYLNPSGSRNLELGSQ
jgi:hypothetical protein